MRLSSVCWTIENNYILSGSEETNIRIWKSDPARKVGPVGKREQRSIQYRKALIEKFKYSKKVKGLKKAHLPKYLLNAKRKKQIMSEAKHRKIVNSELNNPDEYNRLTEPEKDRRFVGLQR